MIIASRDLGTLSRLVDAILVDIDVIKSLWTGANDAQSHWELSRLPDLGLNVCPGHTQPIVVSDSVRRQLNIKTSTQESASVVIGSNLVQGHRFVTNGVSIRQLSA
jgi:hypothetical protein